MLVQNFAEGNEVIDAHDMAMQWGEGPRIDAIARYDCNWGLELLYYGISNWDRSQAVTSDSFGIPGYFVPTLTSLYVFNDVTATARMDLYNAEFNVRRDITPNITGLLGFRYLEVLDRLDLLGTFPSESAGEDSKVKNALYGLQVGPMCGCSNRWGRHIWTASSKGACTTTTSRARRACPARCCRIRPSATTAITSPLWARSPSYLPGYFQTFQRLRGLRGVVCSKASPLPPKSLARRRPSVPAGGGVLPGGNGRTYGEWVSGRDAGSPPGH